MTGAPWSLDFLQLEGPLLWGLNVLWIWKVHTNRVTRLGEFYPIGWLFTLGSYFVIAEVAHKFGVLVTRLRVWINFDKKCVWLHFGRFFTN
jgi:hypothetical protein